MPPYSLLASNAMTDKRILVIYTGGTIGMQSHPNGLAPGR